MKIIGVSGKIGAGKTTIGKHLEKEFGYKLLSFSTPLKKAASDLFSIPLEHFYNSDLKYLVDPFWNLTPRKILQTFGTECMRFNFGFDFWTKCMEGNLKDYKKVVIDDVRFLEEAEMIKKYNGKIIRVTRFDNPYTFKESHISESYKPPFNIRISNNRNIEYLQSHINYLIREKL